MGACRICLVEVSGSDRLFPACTTPIQDGMSVTTNSPKLARYRRMSVELLLIERNHVCAVCVSNGHCELQSMATAMGIDTVGFAYNYPHLRVDQSHPRYVLDHNRCILCTRCVRVCAELEGAHVWELTSRGIHAHIVSDMNEPWGKSTNCTNCGKCVQVCPTGALAEKGWAVEEMVKNPSVVTSLVRKERGDGMKKVKVATVWLDGCSGCHMSLLDMDAADHSAGAKDRSGVRTTGGRAGVPRRVDVTLVEGAVSSQDDLDKLQKIRQRTQVLISLGDCAVTGNVPAMRNSCRPTSCCSRCTWNEPTKTR